MNNRKGWRMRSLAALPGDTIWNKTPCSSSVFRLTKVDVFFIFIKHIYLKLLESKRFLHQYRLEVIKKALEQDVFVLKTKGPDDEKLLP